MPTWMQRALVALAVMAMAGCATVGGQATDDSIKVQRKGDPLAETNVRLGVGYMQQGNLELALVKLRKALELDSQLPNGHYAIALLYERLNRPELAGTHYREAISLNPQYSEAQNAYGVYLCRRDQLEEADQHFQLALKNPLYKTPDLARLNGGICALRAKQYDRAEQYFRQVLQRNPRSTAALREMTRLNVEAGRYLQGRAYLQRYLELARHTSQTLWLGIRIERALGDDNAVASYELLLRSQFPDSEEARLLRESRTGS